MGVCTYYQRGNCRFGANCKNEHPGQVTQATGAFGGGSNANRFGAFNGGGDRYRPGQNQSGLRGGDGNQPLYHLSADTIKADLTQERPTYPLSCYAPGRDAPRQLIEGPVEISPEELRLRYYAQRASGNEAAVQQEETVLAKQMQEQVDRILNNLDGAIKYVEDGANIPGNRLDIAQGKVPVGGASGSAKPTNPFGQAPTNALGGTQSASPAFGQASTPAFGQASTPAFGAGASAFGKPAALGTSGGSAFGAPSALGGGGGGSAFGAPSVLGGAGGVSAFGKPSMPTTSAFGSTSALGPGGAFGKPSMPGATSAFGAGSAFGATANARASPFGQQAQTQAQNQAFGKPAFGSSSSPANPFGGGNQSSPFAQQSQTQASSAFGKPSGLGQTAATFGQPQQSQSQPSPFGQQQQTQNQPSPFGQPQQSQQQAPAFGAASQPGAAFGQSGFAKAASPWGQPQQQQQSQPAATPSPFGVKSQSLTPAPSVFSQSAQSSPFTQPTQTASPFAQTEQQQPKAASPFAAQSATPGSGKTFDSKDRQKEGKPEDYEGERGRILEEIYTRVGRLGQFNDNEDIPLAPPKCEWIVELKL